MSHAKIAALLAASWITVSCTKSAPEPPPTPEAAVKAMTQSLAEKKPGALWDTLPPSYRKDVNELVHEFAKRIDKELYDKTLTVGGKVVRVLKEKKDFILGHPLLQSGMVKVEEAQKNWDSVVGMLETVMESEIRSVDGLKGVDVGEFLSTTGQDVMEKLAAVSALTPQDQLGKSLSMMKDIQVEVLSAGETEAKIKVTIPDGPPPQELEVVKVEGYWLPKDLVDEWEGAMSEAKDALAALGPSEDKNQQMMMLNMVETALDGLLGAENQEQFNQMVGQLMGGFLGGDSTPMAPPTGFSPPAPPPEKQ